MKTSFRTQIMVRPADSTRCPEILHRREVFGEVLSGEHSVTQHREFERGIDELHSGRIML